MKNTRRSGSLGELLPESKTGGIQAKGLLVLGAGGVSGMLGVVAAFLGIGKAFVRSDAHLLLPVFVLVCPWLPFLFI